MILANIEAEIDALEKQKIENYEKIVKLDRMIEVIKEFQKDLLEKDSDYNFRLSELEDELYNENNN